MPISQLIGTALLSWCLSQGNGGWCPFRL